MTNFFLFQLFIIFPSIVFGQKSATYQINGVIDSVPDGTKVYLVRYPDFRDSTIIKNKTFRFNGKTSEPMESVIMLQSLDNIENRKKGKRFWMESSNIKITGSGNYFQKAIVTGSVSNKDFEAYDNYIRNEIKKRGLYDERGKLRYFDGFDKLKDSLTVNFIEAHPKAYKSAAELYFCRQIIPFEKVQTLYNSFSANVKSHYFGKLLGTFITNYRQLKVEDLAPDFTLPNINGDAVSLSSYRGKYVLLSFWGSWCATCRAENKHLNIMYENFKGKGLEILGVGLDSKIALAKAIEKDKIKFTNVFDEREYTSPIMFSYGVWSVPHNMLIDPDGKIIEIDFIVRLEDGRVNQIFENIFNK